MKKIITPLLCTLALAAPVQASVINIAYTAKISGITVRDILDDGSASFHAESSVNLGGTQITRGEKLSGFINYDSDTPYVGPGYDQDPDTASYRNDNSSNSVRLQFDGGYTFNSRALQGVMALGIFNNSPYVYGYDMWGVWAGNSSEWANLTMYDYSGQMFNDTSLTLPSFALARNTVLNFVHADLLSGQHIYFVAELDAIQQVPEPATLATMAAGLGLLGAVRRRKPSRR